MTQANLNFIRDTFETIEPRIRLQKRAPNNWEELVFPNFVPSTTQRLTHYTLDYTGKPKRITGEAGEKLPSVGYTATTDSSDIIDIGFQLDFTLKDEKAALAGDISPFEQKTNAAFNRERKTIFDIIIDGGGFDGLTGFTNKPVGSGKGQIPTVAVGAGGTWNAGKTAEQILDDLNAIWNATADNTDGVSPANTMFLPLQALQIARSARLANSQQTALQSFRESVEDVTGEPFIFRQNQSFKKDIFCARYGEDSARINIAQTLRFGDIQLDGWGYSIPCHFALSGLELLDSFSFARMPNVIA